MDALRKKIRQMLYEILWVNGIGLDDDQILVITTSSHFGSHLADDRYFYNRLTDEFVGITQVHGKNMNLAKDGFFCGKLDLPKAKDAAKRQDLKYEGLWLTKIRGEGRYEGNRLVPPTTTQEPAEV